MPDKSQAPDFSGTSTPPPTDELVLVLTTWPADAPLESVADSLVRAGLVACVAILPLQQSVYRWEGEVQQAGEQQLLLKTTTRRLAELEAAVHAVHPYDVPEWLVLPVTAASAAYGAWVRSSCTPQGG